MQQSTDPVGIRSRALAHEIPDLAAVLLGSLVSHPRRAKLCCPDVTSRLMCSDSLGLSRFGCNDSAATEDLVCEALSSDEVAWV